MKIVPYNPKDSHAVAAFFKEIFRELGWEERASDYMDEPHCLFHLPDGGLLLAIKDDGKVIGTAGVILLSKSEGLIKRFYIEKSHRGTGISQKLLNKIIDEAKELGIKKLVLDVSKSNPRAIRFYEKEGFLPTSVKPHPDWPESNKPEIHHFFYKLIDK